MTNIQADAVTTAADHAPDTESTTPVGKRNRYKNRNLVNPNRRGGRNARAQRLAPIARAIISGVRAAIDTGEIARIAGKVAFTFAPLDRSLALSGPVFADAVRVVWLRGLTLRSGRFQAIPTGGVECVVDTEVDLVRPDTSRDSCDALVHDAGDLLQHACVLLSALCDEPNGQFLVPEVLAAMSPDTFAPEDNHTSRSRATAVGLQGPSEAWDAAVTEAIVLRNRRILPWDPTAGKALPGYADLIMLAPMEMVMRRPLDPEWTAHPANGTAAPKRAPSRDGEVIVMCHGDVESEWVACDGRWVPACQPHQAVLRFPDACRRVYPGLWALKAWPAPGEFIHPAVNSPEMFRETCYANWLDTVTGILAEGGDRLDNACAAIAHVGMALGYGTTETDALLALVNPSFGFEIPRAMPACVVADHGDESLRWESGGLVVDLSLRPDNRKV